MIEIDVLPASTEARGADSILIRFEKTSPSGFSSNQKVILIDGGYAENAERIVKHVKGIYKTDTIDCIICSHPDADHIYGLVALVKSGDLNIANLCVHNPWEHAYTVSRKITDGRSTPDSVRNRLDDSLSALDDLLILCQEKDIDIYHPFSGFKIYDEITVLGPSEEYYCQLIKQYPGMHEERKAPNVGELVEFIYDSNNPHFYSVPMTSARNDSSMVLYLEHEGFSAIFTGDCGVEGLEKAIAYAEANNINIANPNYLQLPHHGSIKNINAEIANKISPKTVFVSAPQNSSNHPSRLIMNYFTKKKGIRVYHVSTSKINFSHGAPDREGWSPVQPVPVFNKIYIHDTYIYN